MEMIDTKYQPQVQAMGIPELTALASKKAKAQSTLPLCCWGPKAAQCPKRGRKSSKATETQNIFKLCQPSLMAWYQPLTIKHYNFATQTLLNGAAWTAGHFIMWPKEIVDKMSTKTQCMQLMYLRLGLAVSNPGLLLVPYVPFWNEKTKMPSLVFVILPWLYISDY